MNQIVIFWEMIMYATIFVIGFVAHLRNKNIRLIRVIHLALPPLMLLSASFKFFQYGPSPVFYAYPMPRVMHGVVPWFELSAGILYFIALFKDKFKLYAGILAIPMMVGANVAHVVFGVFGLFGGHTEPLHYGLAAFTILLMSITVSRDEIVKQITKS